MAPQAIGVGSLFLFLGLWAVVNRELPARGVEEDGFETVPFFEGDPAMFFGGILAIFGLSLVVLGIVGLIF